MFVDANFFVMYILNGTKLLIAYYHNPSNLFILFDVVLCHM